MNKQLNRIWEGTREIRQDLKSLNNAKLTRGVRIHILERILQSIRMMEKDVEYALHETRMEDSRNDLE